MNEKYLLLLDNITASLDKERTRMDGSRHSHGGRNTMMSDSGKTFEM